MIYEILSEFKISHKVNYIVTDNGSNFVCAFKNFSRDNQAESDGDESEPEQGFDEVKEVCTAEILEGYLPPDGEEEEANRPVTLILPSHLRCASHTLSLIGSSDKQLCKFDAKNFKHKNDLRAALSKIQVIWNKIGNRLIKTAKIIKEKFGT